MSLSKIWTAFILVALIFATIKFFTNEKQSNIFTNLVTGKNTDTISTRQLDSASLPTLLVAQLNNGKILPFNHERIIKNGDGYRAFSLLPANGIFETCKDAVNLCIGLIGILSLFMGFLQIAERAGGIHFLSKLIGPFFSKIFPEVPKNHPVMGQMVMNFSANLLGLDNAATPFGIKAMESLQTLNTNKNTASNAQLMFLCLHASGLTIIPTIIIADRVAMKAAQPTLIFIPCMIATFVATIAALSIVSFKQKINVLKPVIIGWVLGLAFLMAMLVLFVSKLNVTAAQHFSINLSNVIILFVFLCILLGGIYKKINVFDAFVDGAKGGFETAVRIIPYLVGLLVAISMLRNSGAFDFVLDGIKKIFILLHADTRIVDALPTALLKPLTGSGARALMMDTMNVYGTDSFTGNLASVFRGSADTTFYIIAVYFGAVNIKNTRYAVSAMLLADLVGILASIALAYIFFR